MSDTAETAETAKQTVKLAKPSGRNGNRLPLGNHPGNTGGKKGRSGGKPAPFKAMLARLRESPELAAALAKAIKDPDCRAFPAALKVLSDYDPDRPADKKELSGKLEVRVRVVRESSKRTVG